MASIWKRFFAITIYFYSSGKQHGTIKKLRAPYKYIGSKQIRSLTFTYWPGGSSFNSLGIFSPARSCVWVSWLFSNSYFWYFCDSIQSLSEPIIKWLSLLFHSISLKYLFSLACTSFVHFPCCYGHICSFFFKCSYQGPFQNCPCGVSSHFG